MAVGDISMYSEKIIIRDQYKCSFFDWFVPYKARTFENQNHLKFVSLHTFKM